MMKAGIRRMAALGVTLAVMLTASHPALAAEGRVNTDSLVLRKSASASSRALQTLGRGDKLDVRSESDGWYRVRYGKYTGYVMKKYVKVTGSVEKESSTEAASVRTLRRGSAGSAVRTLQRRLKELGYYDGSIDGDFGSETLGAVRAFQRSNGLSVDGAAGVKTLAALDSPSAVPAEKEPVTEKLQWFGSEGIIPKGAVFTVKDCATGKTFQAKRWSGANHLDAEPLTDEDAAVMKDVYGGAWSWRRRAILVRYGGRVYAASMNGMPHGTDTVGGNGFDGHFCIHFTGSKTHETDRVDGEHQNAVQTALKHTW